MSSVEQAIELSEEERNLLEQITLDARDLEHGTARANGALVTELMHLLLARKNAIPAHRIRYFTDPDYNIGGRGSSRKQIFERNGTTGDAIFAHPHFLEYARYFVCGPDLPEAVIEAFAAHVEECGQITSGDLLPLAKEARTLARRFRLDPRDSSEEFFKLALEHGLGPSYARIIRDKVRTIR